MEQKGYKKFLKFALHKRYFDTGRGVIDYAKYPLLLLGIAIPNIKAIIYVATAYAILSYFIGWWWLNKGMTEAETEVSNRFNPYVGQIRKKLGIPNK